MPANGWVGRGMTSGRGDPAPYPLYRSYRYGASSPLR